MRYSDGKPEDLERARAAVRQWRAGHPEGTAAHLVADLGAGFHPDWAPVLRAMLFVVDRHAARVVTGIASGDQPDSSTKSRYAPGGGQRPVHCLGLRDWHGEMPPPAERGNHGVHDLVPADQARSARRTSARKPVYLSGGRGRIEAVTLST